LAEIEKDAADRTMEAEELYFDVEEKATELKNQVFSLEAQLRERDDRISALKHQLTIAHQNIANLSRHAGAGAVEHAEPANKVEGATVEKLVCNARAACPHLDILDSAVASAVEVPVTFQFPDRVRAHIEALDEAARLRVANGNLGKAWKEHFKEVGLTYKGRISDTTRNNWGDDYSFLFEGKKVLFEEHFTIGVKSANTCLSIHFSTRLRKDKIVVAYVGRHLRNTQT